MSNEKDFMNAILAAAILGGAQKKEQTQQKSEDTSANTATVAKFLYETYNDLQYVGFSADQAFQLTLALATR